MREPVLITGGAGFIGSNLVHRCVREGISVRVLDDFSSGRRENLAGMEGRIELSHAGLCDRDSLAKAARGVRTIIHIAAVPSVTRSLSDPLATYTTNVNGTFDLLEMARHAGTQRVVLFSSSSVYGESEVLPKRETMRLAPISPYASSKLAAEGMASAWAHSYGLSIVSLRPFNVYGPRQDPTSQYAAVVPRFITSLLQGVPGTIYGDGKQTRDFTYVDDVVEATMLAARWEGGAGEAFNVSGGMRISILDLYETIERVLGVHLPPRHEPARTGDVRHSQADITAAGAFGYAPHVGLEEGLRRTIEWFRSQGAPSPR